MTNRVVALESENSSNDRGTLTKIRKHILRVCPTMSVKDIDSVDSGLRLLETILKKSSPEENSLKEELNRKDAELRKIQKNMTQWKVNIHRK